MRSRQRGGGRRLLAGVAATIAVASGLTVVTGVAIVAPAEAAVVCGASTIEYAYHGACTDYGGAAGWYGSYGPGFATADGWVLAADAPGATAPSPDPTQSYAPGAAPTGATMSSAQAVGFAFSEAQATDSWTGGSLYTADDEATAGQLLYDQLVWGAAIPQLTGGVLAAYDALDGWYTQAVGATGSPQIDMNTTGIGPVPTAGAIYQIRVTFPGSGAPAAGYAVTMALSGAYFTGGATSEVTTTDAEGFASAEIYADSSSTDVAVTASASVGALGLQFYDSAGGAQPVVGFAPPVTASNSDTIPASTAESGAGTISIDEGGDDVAYVGLAGGVYQVIDAQQVVVATLTTDGSGRAGPTQQLPLGTYTVHEETAPSGYSASPDQSVAVIDGGNAIAHFTGAEENLANPATLTISDTDQQTNAALAGATFEIYYDAMNDGAFKQSVGVCTTDALGSCSPPPNDAGKLLPGNYQLDEVGAASGFYLTPGGASRLQTLQPGADASASFSNLSLGSLQLSKTGDDASYYGVAGATFMATGPLPSAGFAGFLTIGSSGVSNVVDGLRPGTYTLIETHPPVGYTTVAPFPVTVALGHATTEVSVVDAIDPATLDVYNEEAGTSTPIVGGVFDVRYDSHDSGTYDTDLGDCTTDAIGACSPADSAGLGLLPGRYEVTELSAPAGFALDPRQPTREVVLTPGAVGLLDFADPRLVTVSFTKTPTGNYDPAGAMLAGAVYDVYAGSGSGPLVASCTTGAFGTCTTARSLVSGDRYCWQEVTPPPGFEGGETGCLVANDATSTSPIVVREPGEYVSIDALKVAAGDPDLLLPGALLDLYRMGHGEGPPAAAPPAGTPPLDGGTWVASATSSASGPVEYPLQLPGYAYCVVEASPPPGYLLDATPHCTTVLAGSPVVPPVTTTVTVPDDPVPSPAPRSPSPAPRSPAPAPAPRVAVARGTLAPTAGTVTITAHKYDALQPSSPIAGAVYDLYVVGSREPAAVAERPSDPVPAELAGDTWVARSSTDADGDLSFTVPAGYAWCLKEVVAPPDFVFDPLAHCTTLLASGAGEAAAHLALPEKPVMVDIEAQKYNSLQPDTGIPGASYDVYSVGAQAPGAQPPPVASPAARVAGDTFYARGVTGRAGELVLFVPAGHAWCLKETRAPPAYRFDPGLHCTAVLTSSNALVPVRIALAELPKHLPGSPPRSPQLPFTGIALDPVLALGGALGGGGTLLMGLGRRGRARRQRTGRPSPQ